MNQGDGIGFQCRGFLCHQLPVTVEDSDMEADDVLCTDWAGLFTGHDFVTPVPQVDPEAPILVANFPDM